MTMGQLSRPSPSHGDAAAALLGEGRDGAPTQPLAGEGQGHPEPGRSLQGASGQTGGQTGKCIYKYIDSGIYSKL